MSWVPTKVVLYSYASGSPLRAAEFRWNEAEGVTLDVSDPEWGVIAERYLADGVVFHEEERRVRPAEGAAFMRALVQPSQSTYVQFVDESDPGPEPGPEQRGGGYTPLQAYRLLAGLPVDDEPGTSAASVPEGPPLARTGDEAQLYMDLHPCVRCASVDTPWESGTVVVDGAPARLYFGDCGNCGAARRFEFRLPEPAEIRVTEALVDFGGPERSQLLDPGEWLWVADLTASRVPVNNHPAARHALSVAVAAMEEILKFVPDGAARVPPGEFRTTRGREVYDAEPGRFERERLVIVRDTYRDALARLPQGGTR